MNQDLTNGNIRSLLWRFTLPLLGSMLFQQLYNIADSLVAGKFISSDALAAVGNSYEITLIFIAFAFGSNMGSSVVVSQYFGAGRKREMKTAVTTTFIATLALSIVLTLLGLLFTDPLLEAINTPPELLAMSASYLDIYILGLVFLFFYNIATGIFTAMGDSRTPFIFLAISSTANIGMDILFVTAFGMGVEGVAWATFLCQGVSSILALSALIIRLRRIGEAEEEAPLFSWRILRQITMIAIPSILQQSTVSIGMMLVQSVVNSFGAEALAGFSAAMRLESIAVVPMAAIGNAMSSYTAQNIGAGKLGRVVKGYHTAYGIVAVIALVIMLPLELFSDELIYLFLGDDGTAAAMDTGISYITFMGWFFIFIGMKMITDGLLRGSGDMKVFTIANIVNLSIRVLVAFIFAPLYGIEMVWIAVPIGWAANWIISYWGYHTGKWKSRLRIR